MKLKRLIIQGFKSFKDKTVIHFDDGITGIVGPNGCGKSNIVDALFWVMGEQSAKHLRGTKMQDLIFSGSSKYNPASWAEVSLVLSNEEGKHIHIGQKLVKPSEIQITRKLYKNGDTEYRINNFPCRLKDIHEVFMDTGAGAKSYSIIAQGEINRLVQAKPIERRAMIEDVAGVTKFKVRRKESLKKIENTQVNLDRLTDLETEIYKQLKNLEKQAEKAQRAVRLKEKLERQELIVNSHKEYDLVTSFRDLKVGLEEGTVELEQLKTDKESLELSLEDERIKKEELLDNLNVLEVNFNESSKELAANKERLNYSEKNLEEKEVEQQRLDEDILDSQSHLENREERLVQTRESLEQLLTESTDGVDLEEMKSMVESLQEQREEAKEKVQNLNGDYEDLQKNISQNHRALATVEAKTHEFSNSLESLTLEIEELEKETSQHLNSLSGDKEKLQVISSKRDTLKSNLAQKQNELLEVKDNLKKNRERQQDNKKRLLETEARYNSLQMVNDSLSAGGEKSQQFFELFGKDKVTKLGELLETSDGYAQCVDALMSHWLDYIFYEDQEVDNWLKDNSDISVSLIKDIIEATTSSETITRLEVLGAISVKPVWDIIKVKDQKWLPLLEKFFIGFYIVENLDLNLMSDISSSINFKGLVSLDGQYLLTKDHGLIVKKVRGEKKNHKGIIERNNEIRDLEKVITSLKEEIEKEQPVLENLIALQENVENEVESLREEYNKVISEYHGAKSSYEAKEKFSGNNSEKLQRLLTQKEGVSKQKLDLLEEQETLIKEKEQLEESLEGQQEILEGEKELLEELEAKFQSQREDFVSLQVKANSFEDQKLNFEKNLSDLEKDISHYQENIESKKERKLDLAESCEGLRESIENLRVLNTEQVEELALEQEKLIDFKESVSEITIQMKEREDQAKDYTQKINKLEKEIVVAQTRIVQIEGEEELLVRDTFERYQVNLRKSIVDFINLEEKIMECLKDISDLFSIEGEQGLLEVDQQDYVFEKKFPGQIKESREKFKKYKSEFNRLGEINWEAVGDYNRQKDRHDFLKKQEEELKKSLNDLQMAIDHIDEKSIVRFKEAFEEVNARFVKVFPIIFGGGSATLKIVGKPDDPESGIDIIAQPPGKKMQNINLMSGGEKAMTAVSLIFSIFLVKPSPFCLLDEVDAPLDDANVGRFNELLREMSSESQFILITHNKKTMELNDVLYGVTMQEPGISKAISVQLQ